MYIRMLWGRLRRGMWDEYEKYYNDHIEPLTRGRNGFRGRQLLRSAENPDEGMSVTVWDTRQDLDNYDRSPERQQASREVDHMYTGEYWVRIFEVRSSTFEH